VFFNPPNKLLQLLIQQHRLSPKDQLVQVLTVFRLNGQTRIDVLVNECVIKYSYVRQPTIPCVILEHGWRRTAAAVQNNMRGILRRKPAALCNRNRVATC
jgi:hypothetical protein